MPPYDAAAAEGRVTTVSVHVSLRAGSISAWHLHERKTDHLMVTAGHLRAVLYDDRAESPTQGRVNVLHLSLARPTLVVIPPRVWHGIQNLSACRAASSTTSTCSTTSAIPTTGACRPTRTRSRTASAERLRPHALDGRSGAGAARRPAGIDRVGVDLERLGKRERQAGLGTWISPHRLDDLRAVAPVLRRAQAFARIDPPNPRMARDVEAALAAGAQVVMLPMFTCAEQVDAFVRLVGARAEPVVLLERCAAVAAVDEVAAVPGLRELERATGLASVC